MTSTDLKEIRIKVVEFLKKHGMDFEDIDIGQSCNVFLEEMQRGLAAQESSLQMIPTYIETDRDVPANEPVIAVDAGGTNFRVATVYFDGDGKPVLENLQSYSMPGLKEHVGKERFFGTMAEYLGPVVNASSKIGLCFSYPAEILPNRDGRLIRFSKEIMAPEVVGEIVGENLAAAIRKSGHQTTKQVVLLNDTVATLLAGRAGFGNRTFSSYVGFILGTGTNCCYIERNKNIMKKKDLDAAKTQIINVESGAFGKAPRGAIDLQFDESTLDPGMSTFEKMISGAYLGPLCRHCARAAAEDGLFTEAVGESLRSVGEIDTKQISEFMYCPTSGSNPLASAVKSGTETDVVTLYYLIDRLIERAAKLTAINLSSMVLKSGRGENPCSPVCIVAEGTTFYELKSLKTRVEYYLKEYLENSRQRYYEIVRVENATLIGAAIAGLTN
jgi:hexokinase